ncbi:hypothetical protein YE105_P0049 (plasmid) [Yersinia enterocolitica subsp. palearctica 105.5R(r)]|nr:hypothetical protein YE105_P0049 [Yersinia enterocolitica subsp. palearctica 105.5R(r)]ELI8309871.1 hypothetical protein [Yersinia enterocolitica]
MKFIAKVTVQQEREALPQWSHQRDKTEPLAGNKADESAQYYQLSATWPSL